MGYENELTNKRNLAIPDPKTLTELIKNLNNVFKGFLKEVALLQLQYGDVYLWLDDNIKTIADFREVFNSSSDSEISDFFRVYMDYNYLINASTQFNNLSLDDIKKLGLFIELKKEQLAELELFQKKKLELIEESDEQNGGIYTA